MGVIYNVIKGNLHNLITKVSRPNYFAIYGSVFSRRYSQETNKENGGNIGVEKAPSTLEEFERLREEHRVATETKEEQSKISEAKQRQGVATQTVEKGADALEKAISSDARLESIKERCKEPVGVGNFRRSGDEDPNGVDTFSQHK